MGTILAMVVKSELTMTILMMRTKTGLIATMLPDSPSRGGEAEVPGAADPAGGRHHPPEQREAGLRDTRPQQARGGGVRREG